MPVVETLDACTVLESMFLSYRAGRVQQGEQNGSAGRFRARTRDPLPKESEDARTNRRSDLCCVSSLGSLVSSPARRLGARSSAVACRNGISMRAKIANLVGTHAARLAAGRTIEVRAFVRAK